MEKEIIFLIARFYISAILFVLAMNAIKVGVMPSQSRYDNDGNPILNGPHRMVRILLCIGALVALVGAYFIFDAKLISFAIIPSAHRLFTVVMLSAPMVIVVTSIGIYMKTAYQYHMVPDDDPYADVKKTLVHAPKHWIPVLGLMVAALMVHFPTQEAGKYLYESIGILPAPIVTATMVPTAVPTFVPTATATPTKAPTATPTLVPTVTPTAVPTFVPVSGSALNPESAGCTLKVVKNDLNASGTFKSWVCPDGILVFWLPPGAREAILGKPGLQLVSNEFGTFTMCLVGTNVVVQRSCPTPTPSGTPVPTNGLPHHLIVRQCGGLFPYTDYKDRDTYFFEKCGNNDIFVHTIKDGWERAIVQKIPFQIIGGANFATTVKDGELFPVVNGTIVPYK